MVVKFDEMVLGGAQLEGQEGLEEVGLGEDLPARLAGSKEVVHCQSKSCFAVCETIGRERDIYEIC